MKHIYYGFMDETLLLWLLSCYFKEVLNKPQFPFISFGQQRKDGYFILYNIRDVFWQYLYSKDITKQ